MHRYSRDFPNDRLIDDDRFASSSILAPNSRHGALLLNEIPKSSLFFPSSGLRPPTRSLDLVQSMHGALFWAEGKLWLFVVHLFTY